MRTITKKSETSAQKNMAKRSQIIEKSQSDYKNMLKKQKSELRKTRQLTSKMFSNLQGKIDSVETKASEDLIVNHLKHTMELNKIVPRSYYGCELDRALEPVIEKTIKKISTEINRKSRGKINKDDVKYLISRHLEYYFGRLSRKYAFLKFQFNFKVPDSIPKVCAEDINIMSSKNRKHKKIEPLDPIEVLNVNHDDVPTKLDDVPTKLIENPTKY
jgi:hypothetical protein